MTTPPPQPARIQFTRATAGPPAPSFSNDDSDSSDQVTAAALSALIPEWQLALRAENKAPGTIAVYTDGARRYLTWCQRTATAPMIRTTLQTWMAHLLDAGSAPGTVRTRHQAVRRFTVWVIATGMVQADPFHHRRDEAIIRLMMETGIRAGELTALHTDDLDLHAGRITVRFGKGGRSRTIPVGPATVQAIRDYLDLRRQHPAAEEATLWLGTRGTGFGYDGLGKALRRRAALAGIKGFHPHKFRHTAAHRWLAAGGSESGLMAMAGWTRTDMLVRYTRATAAERAADEAARLNLGDLHTQPPG